jgi:hypothetical protein
MDEWGSRGREFESLHPDHGKADFERNLLFCFSVPKFNIANIWAGCIMGLKEKELIS